MLPKYIKLRITWSTLVSENYIINIEGECSVFFKKIVFWMKTMHYPNTVRSHLVTIVRMAPYTPKSTSKLRFARHIRYSIVIPRFISRANTVQF